MLITFHIFHIHKSPCLPRGLISGVECLMWYWCRVRGDNAPNQEAEGVRTYGQLPFFRATIRVTSGYEMKSELLTRRLVLNSPKAPSLTWYVTENSYKGVVMWVRTFRQWKSFNLWLDHAPHESRFPLGASRDAHKIRFKINFVWVLVRRIISSYLIKKIKAEYSFAELTTSHVRTTN